MHANSAHARSSQQRRTRAALWCAVFVSSLPLTAAAQSDSTAQASAREAYQAGVTAYQRGDYAQARAQFEAADRAYPSPNVKLMLGRALLQAGDGSGAHAVLRSSLRQARELKDARYQGAEAAARDELQQLEKRSALINLRIADPTAQAVLRVAGREIPRDAWDAPMLSEPGAIEVALVGPDGQRDVKQLELSAGTAVTLVMAITEQPPLKAAATPTATAPEPEKIPPAASAAAPAPQGVRSYELRPLGYIAAGIGAAGIVAFGVLGALSNTEHADLIEGCPSQQDCDPKLEDHATRGSTYQTLANVSLGVGIAALATGVVLWVLGSPDEQTQARPTARGIELVGRF